MRGVRGLGICCWVQSLGCERLSDQRASRIDTDMARTWEQPSTKKLQTMRICSTSVVRCEGFVALAQSPSAPWVFLSFLVSRGLKLRDVGLLVSGSLGSDFQGFGFGVQAPGEAAMARIGIVRGGWARPGHHLVLVATVIKS